MDINAVLVILCLTTIAISNVAVVYMLFLSNKGEKITILSDTETKPVEEIKDTRPQQAYEIIDKGNEAYRPIKTTRGNNEYSTDDAERPV